MHKHPDDQAIDRHTGAKLIKCRNDDLGEIIAQNDKLLACQVSTAITCPGRIGSIARAAIQAPLFYSEASRLPRV
jgi:hypothetical protein